jgi:hypothetical protein
MEKERGSRRSCLHPGPKGPVFHGKKKEDKDVAPKAPLWDISVLDRLEEALRPTAESLDRSEGQPHA